MFLIDNTFVMFGWSIFSTDSSMVTNCFPIRARQTSLIASIPLI